MYTDQHVIKKNLDINLFNQFGNALKNDVFLLIEKLGGKDTYIDENVVLKLQNILPLTQTDAVYLVNLAIELSSASAVASVLLLEKIPTITYYGLTQDIGSFLSNITDYGSRAVALFLGSEQTNTLRVEDLVDVLEQTTLPFYKALLSRVNSRHQEFGVCCAMIMRFAAKIESVIDEKQIDTYLDICSRIVKEYGAKITEQYIRHSHEFIKAVTLDKVLVTLDQMAKKSIVYVEFAARFPHIIFSLLSKMPKVIDFERCGSDEVNAIKLDLLKSDDFLNILEYDILTEDKNYLSLVMNWPNLSSTVKNNILFQLEKDNYKSFILSNEAICADRAQVNLVTNSSWLKSWMYCTETIDLDFIRKKMRILLQEPRFFSLEAKSIIKKHRDIFDRSNTEYTDERVFKMINALLSYCIDSTASAELCAMADFLKGNPSSLRDYLSQTDLVIQTWDRNPWIDYGRSDEFFSCTSLGDYNSGMAPAFLSDINLNNLDIWSHGARVGRLRLCLIKDASNKELLLLDCLDGTERSIASQKKFDIILSAVFAYASYLGIAHIKLNYDVDFNTTPKKFIGYLEGLFQDSDRVEFVSRYLEVGTGKYLIPYPCQTFLESFVKNTGAFVRGALINCESIVSENRTKD